MPLHLMLDKLGGGSSDEQRTADRFVARLRELGRAATTIDFGGPDILTGVSLTSIAEVLPHDGQAIRAIALDYDWNSVLDAYAEAEPTQKFKTIVVAPEALPSEEVEVAMQGFFAEPQLDP